MAKRWTKEEEEYLMGLYEEEQDDGNRIPLRIIAVLFNDHFERTKNFKNRSVGALESRIWALTFEKEGKSRGIKSKLITKNRKKEETGMASKASIVINKDTVRFPKSIRENAVNSRRGWTPADDNFLLKNYTSNLDEQMAIAKTLGRTNSACKSRLCRLKTNKEYFNTVMGSHVDAREVEDETIAEPTNYELPMTFWGYLVLWWRSRKKRKVARRRYKLEEELKRLS